MKLLPSKAIFLLATAALLGAPLGQAMAQKSGGRAGASRPSVGSARGGAGSIGRISPALGRGGASAYGYGGFGGLGYGGLPYGGFGGSGLFPGYGAYSSYGNYASRPAAGIIVGSLFGDPYNGGYSLDSPYGSMPLYPPGDVFGGRPPMPGAEDGPAPRKATATVEVILPNAMAELWFNGAKTQSTGLMREFVTPELEPGKTYVYEVRVRWTSNGREFDVTRKLSVHAGSQGMLNFTGDERETLPPPAALLPPPIKI